MRMCICAVNNMYPVQDESIVKNAVVTTDAIIFTPFVHQRNCVD